MSKKVFYPCSRSAQRCGRNLAIVSRPIVSVFFYRWVYCYKLIIHHRPVYFSDLHDTTPVGAGSRGGRSAGPATADGPTQPRGGVDGAPLRVRLFLKVTGLGWGGGKEGHPAASTIGQGAHAEGPLRAGDPAWGRNPLAHSQAKACRRCVAPKRRRGVPGAPAPSRVNSDLWPEQ